MGLPEIRPAEEQKEVLTASSTQSVDALALDHPYFHVAEVLSPG
jgi:hypothetical protein